MPQFKNKEVSIAFDMFGCPNRCRHCWLGKSSGRKMDRHEVYIKFKRIREHVVKGLEKPCLDNIKYFASNFREPDFSNDYKELFEKELEYNNGVNFRKNYELLSIWRLARDEEYAKWAKEIGTKKCQITLFGMEETTDWFYRRKGAFKDCIIATKRLLRVGIKPRWQLFLTKRIIPELGDLLNLIDQLNLRKRVKELGSDFEFFMHDPSPTGEGRKIEYLRPTIDEIKNIPKEIVEATKRHFKRDKLYYTEMEWLDTLDKKEEKYPIGFSYPNELWFFVDSNWDVYSNIGTLEPWWRLGNLKETPLNEIFSNFRENKILGLKVIYSIDPKQLAKLYGNLKSSLVYMSKSDLLSLYIEKYCERCYNNA